MRSLVGTGHDEHQCVVAGVHRSAKHSFSKSSEQSILLLEGLGVDGDAHCGITVKHRYDAKRHPTRPNLRQVHLLPIELLEEVKGLGFSVQPGDLGENITTRGLDLLVLPNGARLAIGHEAIVEITGIRKPCVYIDRFRAGLLAVLPERRVGVDVIRNSGVMSIVIRSGLVCAGDFIAATLPSLPHHALEFV